MSRILVRVRGLAILRRPTADAREATPSMQSSLKIGSGQKPARGRAQALVEFGLIVMLFVLLLSGVFDFGMLINTRLGVSSLSGVLARAAASGATQQQIDTLAMQQSIAGVTTAPYGGQYWLSGTFPTRPDQLGAAVAMTETFLDSSGTPVSPQTSTNPQAWAVRVEVVANGAEVITPFIRPIFGCNGAQQQCLVTGISATTTMRMEPNAGATPTGP
jgi:Flp pilus assembly protein TadG